MPSAPTMVHKFERILPVKATSIICPVIHIQHIQSICNCGICTTELEHFLIALSAYMTKIEVGSYVDRLFCLKRDFNLSNLPPESCIKIVKKPSMKSDRSMKVTAINLFDMDGEITVLELWNDSAILGVRYLWEQLGNENEILLQFKNLDPPAGEKK